MPVPDKPRHRSGYATEETEQVRAACLTVAVTLGAYLDDLCIVGGLVPALLIDTGRTDARDDDNEVHPGTNDLDIGLALALLDDERYAEMSARLRAEGFQPDTNENGNPTVQRWRLGELKVTVDFLMAPAPDQDPALRVQNLQSDFGALVTPGLELAFDERVSVDLDGHTLKGERVRRSVPVCGPAAFVVLKALAFGDRGEPKDAYDLVYVVRHTPGRGAAIAARLRSHAECHAGVVARASSCSRATSTRRTDSDPAAQRPSRSPPTPNSTTRSPTPTASSMTSSALAKTSGWPRDRRPAAERWPSGSRHPP